MIFLEDKSIKVGGVVLPGIVKSIEITGNATIEEQDVEGKSQKPKQAVGYDNAKITIELVIDTDKKGTTKEKKIETIQKLFRASGQAKSKVFNIVSEHTASRNINKIYFKSFSTKHVVSTTLITASLEFWEYEPLSITSKKKIIKDTESSAKVSTNSQVVQNIKLSKEYNDYLDTSRGTAPTLNTVAKDNVNADEIKKDMKGVLNGLFSPK